VTGQGYFAPLTTALKEAVAVPVILTGGITEPAAAEKLLAEGRTDLVGVGRAILKDSKWAKKAFDSLH
jgi:2,4-dienoyl-CoA reductase-like NADH-dependent reductase (Old Yellow Enzyme family)